MQRLGEGAARVFKTLAGQDRDEPLSSFVIALYCLLFLMALMIVIAWVTGAPLECVVRPTC
ncbi:MAG TPA: hypothetical protein VNA28_08555 [Solirubrobacteraceae bacterium]|nr:hypothetical protein [Solirubrobacteraceae bacterium]